MSAVTPEETRVLAHLARLSLTEAEVEAFSPQLAKILTYIEQLQQVDVSAVPEFMSGEMPGASLREDAVGDMLPADEALSSVPVTRGRMVVVPKFKED